MRSMIQRFLAIFLPLAAIFVGVFWYVQDKTARSQRAIVEDSEICTVALQSQAAASALQDINLCANRREPIGTASG